MSFGYQIYGGVLDLLWQFSHPLLGVAFVQILGSAFQFCGVVSVPKNVGILDAQICEFDIKVIYVPSFFDTKTPTPFGNQNCAAKLDRGTNKCRNPQRPLGTKTAPRN